MTQIDLDKLTFAELQDLQEKAASKALERRSAEIAELRNEVKAMIKSKGFTFEEVFGSSKPAVKATRSAPVVKYRDTDNPENTWAGRGPRPAWLREKLDAGASIEDFAV